MKSIIRNHIILLLMSVTFSVFAQADQSTYLADIVSELEKQWPDNHTITIVCHGHSVPAGYFKTPLVNTFNAYPHLLHQELKKRFPFAVINVIVTAIGGENSESGAARFASDVLPLKPDIVTIDYALNDRGLSLEKTKACWEDMIQQAKAANAKIFLLTPTPDKRADIDDPNDPLNQHAEQIRTLAQAHNVGLVDSYALFKQAIQNGIPLDDLMSQVNHPNRQGHDLVVNELIKWFEIK